MLNRIRVHLKLYSLKINKCTDSNCIQTIISSQKSTKFYHLIFSLSPFFQNDLQCIKYLLEVVIQPSILKIMKHFRKRATNLKIRDLHNVLSSLSLSSVTQSCLTFCDPMECSRPGLHVHHQLLELAQTQVHEVSDGSEPQVHHKDKCTYVNLYFPFLTQQYKIKNIMIYYTGYNIIKVCYYKLSLLLSLLISQKHLFDITSYSHICQLQGLGLFF